MDPIVLLVVGGVGLAGCVILLLLGLNMAREERGHKAGAGPVSASLADSGAPQSAAAASGSNPFAGVTARLAGGGARSNAHEVLRVLRDNLTGRLMLEIAGKRYASLDEVSEGEMRQALLTTVHDLEAFVGGAATGAAAVVPAVAVRQALAAQTSAAPAEYKPLPPPSMNPFKQMAVLREIAKNPPPAPKSITEQIDDVLQARIIGTPLIHRNLHVKPGPRGDAIFEADGQSYASVEQLPDVEVRDAIRAAIVEWESKQ